MPARRTYTFGGVSFTSIDAVKSHAAEIRTRYPRRATISAAEDHAFLFDLLQGHIHRDQKIGPGIRRFYWDRAPDHPSDCFWIERLAGADDEFGVPACLQGIAQLNRQSLRMAISPQIAAFKADALAGCGPTFRSAYSNREFPVEEAVVDHATPFETFVTRFFGERGVDISREMLTRSKPQSSEPDWINPALIAAFLDAHRSCPLRLVHRRENLSEIRIAQNIANSSS